MVEWAARLDGVPDALGPDVIHLDLSHGAEGTRHLTLTPRGRWVAQLDTLRNLLFPTSP